MRVRRLRQRAQFEAVLQGPALVRTPHFALHLADPLRANTPQAVLFPVEGPWLGVLVPKRWAKRAVTRNTIRRQIYANAQAFEALLPPQAMVVRLRAGFSRQDFVSATSEALKAAIRNELQELLGRHLPRRWARMLAETAAAVSPPVGA